MNLHHLFERQRALMRDQGDSATDIDSRILALRAAFDDIDTAGKRRPAADADTARMLADGVIDIMALAIALGIPLPDVLGVVMDSNESSLAVCDACRGTGRVTKVDEDTDREIALVCTKCGGTGRVALRDGKGNFVPSAGYQEPGKAIETVLRQHGVI